MLLLVSGASATVRKWSQVGELIVPGAGNAPDGLSWEDIGTEFSRWSFPWRFIQPLVGDQNLDRAVEFVLGHPGWRLSTQAHKAWNVQ